MPITWGLSMTTETKKCSQDICKEDATFEVHWPGAGYKPVCVDHKDKMIKVLGAMGVATIWRPIDKQPPGTT